LFQRERRSTVGSHSTARDERRGRRRGQAVGRKRTVGHFGGSLIAAQCGAQRKPWACLLKVFSVNFFPVIEFCIVFERILLIFSYSKLSNEILFRKQKSDRNYSKFFKVYEFFNSFFRCK
jgi:hypothetical protein